jgi:hypothetical protein
MYFDEKIVKIASAVVPLTTDEKWSFLCECRAYTGSRT